ncbi:MAG TPA: hypothetical protein VFO16_24195 [Pseudonocardiaceae bacterium]|nr:hypothetical protein [Pseudonocardiaceae bacterium]
MAVDFAKLNTDLDAILEMIPEEQRAAARPLYSRLQDQTREVSNLHRQVTTVANEQSSWWQKHQNDVTELHELKQRLAANANANGNGNGNGNPIQQAVDLETVRRLMQEQRAADFESVLGLVTTIPDIPLAHFIEFGEKLNSRELAAGAMKAGKPVEDYYREMVAERRQKKADEVKAAELAKAREEGVAAGRKEILERTGQGMPYPVGMTAPTTLAGLKKPGEGQVNPYSLEAAVATANEVMARGSGT